MLDPLSATSSVAILSTPRHVPTAVEASSPLKRPHSLLSQDVSGERPSQRF